jgi:hypothetical protein
LGKDSFRDEISSRRERKRKLEACDCLEVLELSQNEVNNPRNFLRLHATIEKAFDKKKLYFERVPTADPNLIQLKVIILDPSLLQETIIKGNNDAIAFNDINGKLFDYVFTHENPKRKPFMRLLA